jgi:hypothetical protein
MKKATNLFIAGAAVTLLPFAVAVAQSPAPSPDVPQSQTAPTDQNQDPSQGQSRGASFDSLDTNHDGRISRAEAQANPDVLAQFSRYDVNGDGYIERSEVNQANNPQPDTPKQ